MVRRPRQNTSADFYVYYLFVAHLSVLLFLSSSLLLIPKATTIHISMVIFHVNKKYLCFVC